MNEALFAVYINSERIYRRALDQARRKTELKLALYIVNNRIDRMSDLVAQVLYDPDHFQAEYDSIPEENVGALDALATENMRKLIYAVVPKALWRRELDLPLSGLEIVALCGEIPGIWTHPAYKCILEYVTIVIQRVLAFKCRQCASPIHARCSSCHRKIFCSNKCFKSDLEDGFLSHKQLECHTFQEIHKQSPR